MKGANKMTITYQDELGVVAVKVHESYEIVFGFKKVFFTDENDNDYSISSEHLISISAK